MFIWLRRKIFSKNAIPFWLVFVVYIPVLFLFYKYAPDNPDGYSFPILMADSTEYVELARNIITNKVFSYNTSPPFNPEYFRTPGYPIFLAFILLFFKSYYAVSVIQIFLVGMTAFLIFKIGQKIVNSTAGLIAAFLYVVNGSTLFYAITVMSDILFTFLLVLAVYLMFFIKTKREFFLVFGVGALIGFATLVRTISVFLPGLFLLFYFFYKRNFFPLKRMVVLMSIFIIGFAVVLFPWMVRNKIHSGVWGISSLAGYNLFNYNVPLFLSRENNKSMEENRAMLYEEIGGLSEYEAMQFKNSQKVAGVAKRYLMKNLIGYAKFHLSRLPEYFGGNSSKNFYVNVIEIIWHKPNPFPQKTQLLDDILGKKDIKFLWDRLASQSFFPLEYILWAIVLCLSLVSIIFRKYRNQAIFFIFIALYFAVLVGPTVHVRYRIPAEPFMFLSALMGFYGLKECLINLWKRKKLL